MRAPDSVKLYHFRLPFARSCLADAARSPSTGLNDPALPHAARSRNDELRENHFPEDFRISHVMATRARRGERAAAKERPRKENADEVK